MGEGLEGYRQQIDRLDDQLVELMEQRLEVARKIGQYKQEHHLPVLNTGREQAVLEKTKARLRDQQHAQAVLRFMHEVIAICRESQNRQLGQNPAPIQRLHTGRVGYPGVAGSFSEQAAASYFGEQFPRQAYVEFEEVCKALQAGELDYGVLPIENSSTGGIAQVYDLLGQYGFSIVGECLVRVNQNLAGLPGADLAGIRRVYSHSQAFDQSRRFLNAHRDWKQIPFHNTAVAAQHVAQQGDPAQAAICSRRAAECYGLEILAGEIQDIRENITRFIVVAREPDLRGANKVSVTFLLDHEAGTLYNILRLFAEAHINLVKVESRPIPGALWHYRFYLDFEGNLENPQVQQVLRALEDGSQECKILGAYQAAAQDGV